MNKFVIQIIGWYGVLAIIVAYALINFGVVNVNDLGYQLLNLTGAAAIILETYSRKDYQPMVLNFFWLLIALVVLVRMAV